MPDREIGSTGDKRDQPMPDRELGSTGGTIAGSFIVLNTMTKNKERFYHEIFWSLSYDLGHIHHVLWPWSQK